MRLVICFANINISTVQFKAKDKMELKTAIEILEYHQEWRLGKREDMIHEPKKLTQALDIVLNEVKKLLPQDNFCKVCNLPTDGEKCYSKRCPV